MTADDSPGATDSVPGDALYRLRFPVLAGLVFILSAVHAVHGHWICRLTGASAVTELAVASLVNLVMLLVALRTFVRRFAPSPAQTDAVSFYLLLFMLLLWGIDPWDYSGFFHISVIVHALPYPSAFAFWVSLLLLALNERRVADGAPRLLLLIVPLSAAVLLVHPPTFLFVVAGLVAMAVDAPRRLAEALVAVFALAAAAGVALMWPYSRSGRW